MVGNCTCAWCGCESYFCEMVCMLEHFGDTQLLACVCVYLLPLLSVCVCVRVVVVSVSVRLCRPNITYVWWNMCGVCVRCVRDNVPSCQYEILIHNEIYIQVHAYTHRPYTARFDERGRERVSERD